MKQRLLPVVVILLSLSLRVLSQDTTAVPKKREFKKLDIFPAISYSPETKLTLGAIGIKYFDFSKGDATTPISNLEFLGVYTLNKQIIFESRWELFFTQSKWRSRGELFFNRYPDRNYGMGNTASARVVEVDKDGERDTLNYLNFNSDRIKFSPVILRQVLPHFFMGIQYDMEYLFNLKAIAPEYYFLNSEAEYIKEMPVEGTRSGLGIQMLYDTRDFIMNPLKGSLFEINAINYAHYLGSDFKFTSFSADIRQYINTFKNHTLALRGYASRQWTNDQVPMRALSRVGGHKFIRGYFKGTYQDYNLAAFEMEYRLPFWPENTDSHLWQVWKRIGFVGFLSGAQVAHDLSGFKADQFNLAAGGGLRILFNPKTRVNIRIDYAVGLAEGSAGDGKRQSGFYFYLGEAF
ncbi:MAG: BamA/TamA family outer membrane protein [Cyclobacteriaceae bacterium]|nr:BamA/TamA family outer membrane protein [Cyclobacteriaceae bacterium]